MRRAGRPVVGTVLNGPGMSSADGTPSENAKVCPDLAPIDSHPERETVSLPAGIHTRFDRATKISVRRVKPKVLELQYEGVLEESVRVVGPWNFVP